MRGSALLTVSALGLIVGTIACGPTSQAGSGGSADGGPEIRLPPRQSSGYDCQDIPESGQCRDDVAVYCDTRSSSIVEKRCGARGLTCEVADQGARCVDAQGKEEEVPSEPTTPTAGPDCGVVDWIGECDDKNPNIFRYCKLDGTLYETDCSAVNATCGEDPTSLLYTCLPTGCGDVPSDAFVCRNNEITYCTIGGDGWEVDSFACDPGESCIENGTSADCYGCDQVNGALGICVGTKVLYCTDTQVESYDCGILGQSCDPDSIPDIPGFAGCVE